MYVKYYLVASRRMLVALGSSLRRRDAFEPFSILQIVRRRRRSTGIHPHCPYAVMRAAPLGSPLSEVSLVHSSYALRRANIGEPSTLLH
jgi:Fe2+ transport system protein FeoA